MIELEIEELYLMTCHHERTLAAVMRIAREQGIDVVWCEQALILTGRLRRELRGVLDLHGSVLRIP